MSSTSTSTASEPSTALEVRYELDSADAVVGLREGLLGHPLYRRKILPIGALILIVWTTYSFIEQGAIAGMGCVIGTIASVILLPTMARANARRNPAYRGPHSIRVSPDGVSGWTEGVGEMRLLWRQVEAVRGTPTHLVFHWKSGASTLVPRAAFPQAGADAVFIQSAQQWHRAASEAAA